MKQTANYLVSKLKPYADEIGAEITIKVSVSELTLIVYKKHIEDRMIFRNKSVVYITPSNDGLFDYEVDAVSGIYGETRARRSSKCSLTCCPRREREDIEGLAKVCINSFYDIPSKISWL